MNVYLSFIGHRFTWFGPRREPQDGDTCEHCGERYETAKREPFFCVSAWSRDHRRRSFVRALQGTE